MSVRDGKHKLVGLVNLGNVHTTMRTLSGKMLLHKILLIKVISLDNL